MDQHTHLPLKAIVLILIAWFFFTAMNVMSREIYHETTVPVMLVFRNIGGLLFALPWVMHHRREGFKVTKPLTVLIRALSGLLNTALAFLAVQRISLVDTSLLTNTAPLFVPFVVWLWLKRPINHRLWPALILGFIGVIIVLRPDQNLFNFGAMLALLSGACLAVSTVSLRVSTYTEKIHTVLFYYFFIGLLCTLPLALPDWRVGNAQTLFLLLSIGLCSGVGQIILFKALQLGKASHMAPFGYITVIYAALFDWMIWNLVPSLSTLIGTIVICLAGAWIVFHTRAKEH